ncbi:MAG: hypothetical protein Q7V04_10850 [Deltaproteobacteria bacterium]|nr:hypothetical protein [Deltaproteobacteria bacterium]
MSNKIKFTISPAVAAYVRPGVSPEVRLAGCDAAAGMDPFERVTLLFCLSKDPDPSIKSSAITLMQILPEDVVNEYSASDKAHPLVLEFLVRVCGKRPESADLSAVSPGDVEELKQPGNVESVLPLPADCLDGDIPLEDESSAADEDMNENAGEDTDEEVGEEFLSKFKIAQMMGIGEKIKMALSGDKEWRSILVKDSNKLVSGSVIKNPRITESEILKLIKSGIQNDEIMRLICANKEWIKSYQIRKSLIENNRTPVQNAIRYLATMGEKDLAGFAKSKNVTSVISTMAKRLLLNKKR